MVELQGTYCLLEEKTHYVTKLENTLQNIEKESTPKVRNQMLVPKKTVTCQDVVTLQKNYRSSDSSRNSSIISTNSSTIKLKPKNYSTTGSIRGDKMLNRDYVTDVNIDCLTDMILNTLSYNENAQEFVMHARNLARYEAIHSNIQIRDGELSSDSLNSAPTRTNVKLFLQGVQYDLNRNGLRRISTEDNFQKNRYENFS